MAYYSSEESSSDMDLDLLEESENELNITTYFHDDIEFSTDESSDSNDNIKGSLDQVVKKESLEVVDNKEELGDGLTKVPMNIVEDDSKGDVVHKKKKFQSVDDYTKVPMEVVLSPTDTRKKHMTLCPVCYEIAIICKDSTLYDNLIFACMQQRSKK